MKTSFSRILLALFFCCVVSSARAATFDITYTDPAGTGFKDATLGPARKAAFEAAVGVWQQRLTSSVNIRISAIFASLGGSANSAILAFAGPNQMFIDWNNSASPRQAATYYPTALANKLAGRDLSGGDFDMNVTCNADIDNPIVLGDNSWYYGSDGNKGRDIDFFTTMLHELGHGLGFLSSLNENGVFGIDNINPSIFDRFMESGAPGNRVALTAMTANGRAAAQTSSQLFFNGPATRALNGNVAAKLYAPSPYEGGSSASHLDEATFSGNNESMTPYISGVSHDPGPAFTGIFRDMGWTVANPDLTPPAVSCSYPPTGNLKSFTSDGVGTATDVSGTLVPRVQVHLWRRKTGWFWSGSGWFTSSATKLENTPQVPSTFNNANKTWRVAQNVWPSPAELFDREDYMLWILAWDTAGNQTLFTRPIRIDMNPPTVGWNYANGATIADLTNFGGPISQSSRTTIQILENNAPAINRFWNGNSWQNAAPNGSGPELNGGINGAVWNRGATALPSAAQLRTGKFYLVVRAFNASGTVVVNFISVTKKSDSRTPTVAIASPVSGGIFAAFPPLSGTAFDGESSPGVAGSGVQRVNFALQRLADNKYWNGAAWIGPTGLQASATQTTGGNATWMFGGNLPSGANLNNGNYRLQAFAVDFAGNIGAGAISNFSIQQFAARTNSASPVQLSTISAKTDGTIRLTFSGALNASAQDANNYIVSSNGSPIPIANVSQPDASTVEFAAGALKSGARISVSYSVEDSQNRALAGTANIVVK